jgi:hypothetical protein
MKKIILLIILGSLSYPAVAQQTPPLTPVKLSDFADSKPAHCAERTAVLDGIAQKTPADELIIVVARLGDGDGRPRLNWRRLHNVRAYWTEYLYEGREGHKRQPETIILAEGERVKGYGQLEFYVGGKLVWVLKVARNADVEFGDCYPPDDSFIRNKIYDRCWVKSHQIFYPCRDKNVRRKGVR